MRLLKHEGAQSSVEGVYVEEETKLRAIFASCPDAITVSDLNGNIVECNQATLDMGGFLSKDEVIGKSALEFIAKKDRERAMENLKKTLEQDSVKNIEYTFLAKDGRVYPAELSASVIKDSSGNATGFVAITKDITERKQMEEALKRSEEKFRSIFESANDCMIYLDKSGRILDVNRKALEVFGGSRKEVLGKHFTRVGVFSPRDIPRLMSAFAKGLAGKQPTLNVCIRNKRGQEIHLECLGSIMKTDDKLTAMVIAREITERRKAEEMLRASEEKYRTQFEEALDAIFLADAETGIIIDCNRAASESVGREKSELVGKHQRIVHPPQEIEGEFSRTFRQHLKEKEGQVLETQVITKKGEIKEVAVKANVFELEGKKLIQGIFRDITERKKAEKELIRLSSAVKMSTDSIVIGDLYAKIIDVNEATLKMYGTDDKRDLIGKSSFDLIAPEEREKALAGMKETLEKGYLKSREYHVFTKDGGRIPVEMSAAIMKDADGKPIGFVGITRDITERKQAVEALRASEGKLNAMLQSIGDHMSMMDTDLNILWAN